MTTDTLCILAAGRGKRMGHWTDIYNKAMIRVGDKAIISHIIEAFECKNIVITTCYAADLLEQYLYHAHPNKNFTFVRNDKCQGEGAGPGYSLSSAKSFLQKPFYLSTCDTFYEKNCDLLRKDLDTKNVIYYANWWNDGKYSSLEFFENLETGTKEHIFLEKDKIGTHDAYIGALKVYDYKNFWKGMEKPVIIDGEQQVSAGFQNVKFEPVKIQAVDLGGIYNLEKFKSLQKSRIANFHKADEEIYLVDFRIIKYMNNKQVLKDKTERIKYLNGTCPKVDKITDNFYSHKFVEGKDLYQHENPSDYMQSVLEYAQTLLWRHVLLEPKEHNEFLANCLSFYRDKTQSRVNTYFRRFREFRTINKEKILGIDNILRQVNWESISSGISTNFHGDFNFSNIIVSKFGIDKIKFIDWRQDFAGRIDYGDVYYDLAKMYSGFQFPHDSVRNGKIESTVEDNEFFFYEIPISEEIEKCRKIFEKFVEDEGYSLKKIKILSAIIFLNMAPLHARDGLHEVLFHHGKRLLFNEVCYE